MKRILRSQIGIGILIIMLITACSTTRVTSVWKDPGYRGSPDKIMVIGVAKRPGIKRIFEDEFVRQLRARGNDAIASYTVLPDDKQGDEKAIAAKMKGQDSDAVLITRMVSKKTVQSYVQTPGSIYPYPYPYPPYFSTWRHYYGYGYQAMYAPGYLAEDEYAVMETNLYDARSDKLIWSASSETEVMGSDARLVKSFIGTMVKVMAEQRLIR